MDDDDYSWVRRTRFSHSIVRSNSGREQFGAFLDPFDSSTAWRQKRFSSELILRGHNLQPAAKGAVSKSARPSIPLSKSPVPQAERKLKTMFSDGEFRQRGKVSDGSLRETSKEKVLKVAHNAEDLSLDISHRSMDQTMKDESPDMLEFSFHSEEQSLRLLRVCSSPAPFYSNDTTPFGDSKIRSASVKVVGDGSKPRRRAKSPMPTRVISEVFKEAKAATKRFSSPQRQRKSSSPHSPRSPDGSPRFGFSSMRTPSKLKTRRASSWPRNYDNGVAKAVALDILEKWTIDRSQLLIGQRFASGAYSRLFHGIYKEQPVAVKFIRQPDEEEDAELAAKLEKQFTAEVTILARLHHRNVIKLIGACNAPPVFCVITEFLCGGSLRAFLRKLQQKRLPLEKIICIALDIAHGLEYIHSQRVIHRDVKPENILFDGECCAKVVDFGVACEEVYCNSLEDDPGTYRWMAPEMYKRKPYGRKVDVYSFGLLLWELVSGSIPYEEMTPLQAAFAVVNKNLRPVIPSSCPAPLRLLIQQCWSCLPEKRPEFSQIVQILKNLKQALDRDGTLDKIPNTIFQEAPDQNKKKLSNWIQRLSYSQVDFSGPPPPKLL
uniref:Protein kinase domain-containing protein n=1 Tax=Leersia perrieri TaxID=77586 RepID=A0A0D9WIR4_9ORYZ